MQTNWVPLPG